MMGAPQTATIERLQRALEERARDVVKRLWNLDTERPSLGRCAPVVRGGYLPPKRSDDHDDDGKPFLLVRPRMGEEEAGGGPGNTVTFALIVGTYSNDDDDDGFMGPLLVVDALRISLLSKPIVGGCFEVLKASWGFTDDQSRPYWGAQITTVLTMPAVHRVDGI